MLNLKFMTASFEDVEREEILFLLIVEKAAKV